MLRYRVFGGVLSAPFPFPELRPDEGDALVDWSLQVEATEPPPVGVTPVGEDELIPGVFGRLARTPVGLRIAFDDTGTFDVTAGGSTLTWYPAAGSDRALVRNDILGRVLSIAAHERGLLSLHGSAVAAAGRAIAFLAPKGSGKWTLALALATHGAPLLTDDTLPVDPQRGLAYPGVHSVRVWDDSAEHFKSLGDWRVGLSEKRTVDMLPPALLQHEAVPIAALYTLVSRAEIEGAELVHRVPLPPAHGAIALMTHSKLGALMGGGETMHVFDRCATLAACVPVFQLEVVRALDRVDAVAETIMRWHS